MTGSGQNELVPELDAIGGPYPMGVRAPAPNVTHAASLHVWALMARTSWLPMAP